ncbi:fluoride efflux transporter FluC [Phytohabitans kaempferiae]|uniref:Fluoride-specific ion channel FluC n=1 Tax=Phytohabitans kaempferiae TaxID=1620943 RepID=A0ABV6MEY9_9ACTN
MTLVLVLVGGAVGAVTRYLVRFALPWPTVWVNVAGSALLGLLAGLGSGLPGWVGTLVGIGFCGALTTYSTFALETYELGRSRRALWNVAVTLLAGIGAAVVGVGLGRLF